MEENGLILARSGRVSEINPEPDRSFLFPVYKIGDFAKSIRRKSLIKPFVLISTKEAQAFSIFLSWSQFNTKQVRTN
jgi:hypothetical protein